MNPGSKSDKLSASTTISWIIKDKESDFELLCHQCKYEVTRLLPVIRRSCDPHSQRVEGTVVPPLRKKQGKSNRQRPNGWDCGVRRKRGHLPERGGSRGQDGAVWEADTRQVPAKASPHTGRAG